VNLPNFEIVDPEMAAVLRAKTGPERLRIAWGLRESAQRILTSHLRAEHPDWDEQQLRTEVVRRFSHDSG
jgi:hypothetical protein